jgi:hypothetical protein
MNDHQWKIFFTICADTLGESGYMSHLSDNWCSWTTFSRLNHDAGYWTSGLPKTSEINDTSISDGGTWGQPFSYKDIAHIIIPRSFYWELSENGSFNSGSKSQEIYNLSKKLSMASVPHQSSELLLEIKCY